jgi:hypothetical protein
MSRLRVATAVLSERIFAGYPTKDRQRLKEPRHDVTSDVLLAIRDKVGLGHEIEVAPEGGPTEFRIAVLPAPMSVGRMKSALQECETYFEELADAELLHDGPSGNREMQLLVEVRAAIAMEAATAGETPKSDSTRSATARVRKDIAQTPSPNLSQGDTP